MSELTDTALVDEGAIPPDEFWDAIDRTREVAAHALVVPDDLMERLRAATSDLLIPEEDLLAAATGLIAGNLILQGPPGTGKSALAAALARAFDARTLQATAREDWTAFDVIGGQELAVDDDNNEVLAPSHGWFTEAAIDCAGVVSRNLDDADQHPQQATWLIIDELNRANMDRAFGELFTVLGTEDPVQFRLKYIAGDPVMLTTSRRFRIIGTLNSIDKQFVNSLSLAIRRRFTFVTLDIPPRRLQGEAWSTPPETASLAVRELGVILTRAADSAGRAIGTVDQQQLRQPLESVLTELEHVRYAAESSDYPFLPVGTAPLIDMTRLAILRGSMDPGATLSEAFDWACAAKIAPLFETDLDSPEKLRSFAELLRPTFPQFARELARIEAAGLYAVP